MARRATCFAASAVSLIFSVSDSSANSRRPSVSSATIATKGSPAWSVSHALNSTTGNCSLRRCCDHILRNVVLPAPQAASIARTHGPSIPPMSRVRICAGSFLFSKSFLNGSSSGISISTGRTRIPMLPSFPTSGILSLRIGVNRIARTGWRECREKLALKSCCLRALRGYTRPRRRHLTLPGAVVARMLPEAPCER